MSDRPTAEDVPPPAAPPGEVRLRQRTGSTVPPDTPARDGQRDRSPGRSLALLLCLALVIRLALLPTPGYDVGDYKDWTRLIYEVGIGGWYGATYPPPPGWYNYPPLYLYPLRVTGSIYAALFPDGSWDDRTLGMMIKIWPIIAELALGVLLYRFLRRHAARGALLGTAAYLLNPAIIWNTAYWGGIDAIHTFFLSVALFAAGEVRTIPAWALATLAVGAKLQALPGALATVVGGLRGARVSWARLGSAAAAAIAVGLLLIAPILARGQVEYLVRAMFGNLGNTPAISANAHNLWWLLTWGDGWQSDATTVALGLTYRDAGLALFALCIVVAAWRTRRLINDAASACALAAFLSFAFFMLLTGVHENWSFALFAPLVATAVLRPWRGYRVLYAALSATCLANLALHDPPLRDNLLGPGFDGAARALGLLNAAIQCALFVWWFWRLLRPPPGDLPVPA